MRRRPLIPLAVLAAALVSAGAVRAVPLELSTASGATLGGLSFRNADIVRYDTVADTSVLIFSEDNFAGPENIDALELLDNGHLLLSTTSTATLGGITFSNGSLADFDPVSGLATLFFDEILFGSNVNIDAVAVLANGNLILSTDTPATLGGLSFRDGDLVEYDPIAGTSTLFFDESAFLTDVNVDAVDVLLDGTILLSTGSDATLGGLSFRDGDLALYDPISGTATLWFNEDLFTNNENIDAIAAPEPGSAALLGVGFTALALARRRRR